MEIRLECSIKGGVKMLRTAIFLAEGFEEIECLATVDLLRRAAIEVVEVSINSETKVTGAHGITVIADTTIDKMDFNNITMLILPGGAPGTDHLNQCEPLDKLLLQFSQKDKYIAAICAAPKILGRLLILEGKRACCYPGYEKELLGAQVITECKTVTDGNIITGRGAGTAIDFALAIITELKGKQEAERLATSIIY